MEIYDNNLEISTNDLQQKYRRTIEIPPDANIDIAKSTYNNRILEINFNRKENSKPKGREIKID